MPAAHVKTERGGPRVHAWSGGLLAFMAGMSAWGCRGRLDAMTILGDAGPMDASVEAGPAQADAGAEAGDDACPSILADSYDQSCRVSSDCTTVGAGNVCTGPCAFVCQQGATIATSALPQYEADFARLGFDTRSVNCGCVIEFPPCCVAGRCTIDQQCLTLAEDAGTSDDDASASGDDASALAHDAASTDATSPSTDGGPLLFCSDAATAPDGGCLCDYVGDIAGTACASEGASCGVGCKLQCECIDGDWNRCFAPPCTPPPP